MRLKNKSVPFFAVGRCRAPLAVSGQVKKWHCAWVVVRWPFIALSAIVERA